jgi:magnesium transporter
MDNVKAYLYDASEKDAEVDLESVDVGTLAETHLLWVNVSKRDEKLLDTVTKHLGAKNVPCKAVLDDMGRPEVERFDDFFRFCVDSVRTEDGRSPARIMVDFIVGKKYVVTIHSGGIKYLDDFRERDKGESQLGQLDTESFVASLLDLNIVTYFDALEAIERQVDELDELVLKEDVETGKFLEKMVDLRRDTSRLRRWLIPQREVYYSLSRPDFQQVSESDSAAHYQMLNQHFETAVDAIEHAREMVISVFELYATKTTHLTNILVQRLTFLTLITGSIAVIAGILGMNFKADIFELEYGFWITVAGLFLFALGLAAFARLKRWI